MFSDQLKKQHADILAIVTAIKPLLNSIDARNADKLRTLLVDLGAKVNVHLAAEDKVLYPLLMKSPSPKTAEVAKRFEHDMGPIGAAFKKYMHAYPTAAVIQGSAAAFSADTKGIFEALGARIRREETELYPLADAAG